ncbi:hypothetical protein GTP56_27985 [Duganella sp. FT134W]|uniref:Uncharacterized protein n=1 Tax=Duganella margarita TaxID=2692170 RepID=A0A7X4H7J2_9BURK|nr:hypothetical protein [Duganella margarita]MYM76009.1 hypothetical protein [Duganella margarita]
MKIFTFVRDWALSDRCGILVVIDGTRIFDFASRVPAMEDLSLTRQKERRDAALSFCTGGRRPGCRSCG